MTAWLPSLLRLPSLLWPRLVLLVMPYDSLRSLWLVERRISGRSNGIEDAIIVAVTSATSQISTIAVPCVKSALRETLGMVDVL